MKGGPVIVFVAAAALAVGAGGTWLALKSLERLHESDAAEHQGEASAEASPEATVAVKVARVTRGRLEPEIVAFGVVEADPREAIVVSTPNEVIVRRVLVVPGQAVAVNDPVVDVELSSDARLQAELAEKESAAAERAVAALKAKLALKLTTQQEVAAAEATLAAAQARLARLRAGALPEDGVLRARTHGVVRTVGVAAGATASANLSLVTFAAPDHRVVALGIEPSQASLVGRGATVALALPGGAFAAHGQVARTLPALDAGTRLASAIVACDDLGAIPEGTTLRGVIKLDAVDDALLVPRAALLPTSDGDIVFVIEGDHAKERHVRVAHRSQAMMRVLEGLAERDVVVIVGASDLEDGRAVRIVETSK